MSEEQFCSALMGLGLHLTGSFRTQLRLKTLNSRAALYRALLKPALESHPEHNAGHMQPRDTETVDGVRCTFLSFCPFVSLVTRA
jgi:hypothetical protein